MEGTRIEMPLVSYFPEPVTVPDCVADQPYRQRLQFVRRVLLLHSFSVFSVIIGAKFAQRAGLTPHEPWILLGVLAFLVIVATLARKYFREKLSQSIDAVLLLLMAVLSGSILTLIPENELTLLLAGPAWILAYLVLCGKDFSFVGMPTIGILGGGGLGIAAVLTGSFTRDEILTVWFLLAAYWAYVSYDLSMIMKRRRSDELLRSVTDFWRDLTNFVTYPIKVMLHWKRYRFP